MKLVLASSSPRRAELLRAAGFSFEIVPVAVDERFLPDETPERAVARLAEAKALAAAHDHPEAVVLGADTTVVVRNEPLGKPEDADDARRMLRLLSGQAHVVLTGLCVCAGGRRLVHVERTTVRMADLSDQEVEWYLGSGEPEGMAGGYAIQGLASRFIDRIDGSYANVVGLPVSRVCILLKELGCDILNPSNA